MNQPIKHRILAKYPDWHNNPVKLNIPEMQNPYIILNEFFSAYHLTDIRVCMREWLSSAMRRDEILTLDYVNLHDHIERLIEAAWLLHVKRSPAAKTKKKRK